MKTSVLVLIAGLLAAALLAQQQTSPQTPSDKPAVKTDPKGAPVPAATAKSVHDFTLKSIDGQDVPLSRYKGNVLLIVNVASKCGLTPQYEQLEALHKQYHARGLRILGIPANNFGNQEPGSDAEIKQFCTTKFNVTFDMFSKISVKDADQHALYAFLTSKEKNAETAGDIEWNFTKFLIDRDGKVIARFSPKIKPDAPEVQKAIEAALGPAKP